MRRFSLAGVAAAALGASLLVDPADAQSAGVSARDELHGLAQAMIDRGRPERACALLEAGADPANPHPTGLYLTAHCMRDMGRIDDAIAYYERLIALLPDAPKPRVELATLYLVQGRSEDARKLYAEVAATAQDPKVAATLRGLAQQLGTDDPAVLAARTPKRWAVDAFVGAVYDSNVNVGPTSSTVAAVIGGVPVDLTLSPDAAPRKSWGVTANVGGRYLAPLSDRYALLFQGALSKTDYFSAPGFDSDGLALGSALIYRDGGFSANLQPNARWARQDNDLEEATYGVTGRVSQQFAGGWSGTASTGYFYRDVPSSEDKKADGYLGSLGIGKRLAWGIELRGDYLAQREIAEADAESRLMHGPSALLTVPLGDAVEAVANYRYTSITYDTRQTLFPRSRDDDQHVASLAAFWDVSETVAEGVGLRAQYAYTRNYSNIEINDYDRHSMIFGVQSRF